MLLSLFISLLPPFPLLSPPTPLPSPVLLTVVKAVSTINAAIDSGDPEPLMEALTAPAAGIRSITAECAESYQEKLSQAKQEKVEAGRWIGERDGRSGQADRLLDSWMAVE